MRAKFETKKWGIEIELLYPNRIGSFGDLASKVKTYLRLNDNYDLNIGSSGYGHDLVTFWKVLSDASLRTDTGYTTAEIVSPPLKGDAGLAELKLVLGGLRSLGCKINLSTGIHVHHDINNWKDEMRARENGWLNNVASKFSNLISLVSKFETFLFYLQPQSRRGHYNEATAKFTGGRWCSAMNSNNIYKMFSSIKGAFARQNGARKNTMKSIVKYAHMNNSWGRRFVDEYSSNSRRYCGFNLESFWRHGTAEFRYNAGSLNFTKIKNWIVLTQSFVITAEWLSEEGKGVNNSTWDLTNVGKDMSRMKIALGLRSVSASDEHYKEAGKWLCSRVRELNPQLSISAAQTSSGCNVCVNETCSCSTHDSSAGVADFIDVDSGDSTTLPSLPVRRI